MRRMPVVGVHDCGANWFRKAAVSATRSSNLACEEVNQDLASLMGHQKATADRYYYMEDKMNAAQRATEKLPAIMRTAAHSDSLKSNENSSTGTSNDGEMQSTASKERSANSFSTVDVKYLQDIYAAEISKKNFSFSQIRENWLKNPVIGHLHCRKVYDKLRHICKVQSTSERATEDSIPINLPSMNSSEKIAAMERSHENADQSEDSDEEYIIAGSCKNTSSKASRKFSHQDALCLIRVFQSLIEKKSAKMSDIKAITTTNAVAKRLANQYSFYNIQNRIKYERSKSFDVVLILRTSAQSLQVHSCATINFDVDCGN